jgi:hypothetical protein
MYKITSANNHATIDPIQEEVIGNITVTLRPLQNGGYTISAFHAFHREKRTLKGKIKINLPDAIKEFLEMCAWAMQMEFGPNHSDRTLSKIQNHHKIMNALQNRGFDDKF